MCQYTTGEIAKLCGVSVRTVQYYDARGILLPSGFSEGGRRLYSEEDVKKLRIICFLREAGLPIRSIDELLAEADPGSVISLLLEEQAQVLRREMAQSQDKLNRLSEIRRALRDIRPFSVESLGDIAYIMENKEKLSRLRRFMIVVGIGMDLIEIATAILWWKTGLWQPFALGMAVVIALGIWMSRRYYLGVAYICPQCHEVFKPRFRTIFWAPHTPTTRKLTCPRCGHRGHCVETYDASSNRETI